MHTINDNNRSSQYNLARASKTRKRIKYQSGEGWLRFCLHSGYSWWVELCMNMYVLGIILWTSPKQLLYACRCTIVSLAALRERTWPSFCCMGLCVACRSTQKLLNGASKLQSRCHSGLLGCWPLSSCWLHHLYSLDLLFTMGWSCKDKKTHSSRIQQKGASRLFGPFMYKTV